MKAIGLIGGGQRQRVEGGRGRAAKRKPDGIFKIRLSGV